MTDETRFSIVFQRLDELVDLPEGSTENISTLELDEISELRRVVEEVSSPRLQTYTTS